MLVQLFRNPYAEAEPGRIVHIRKNFSELKKIGTEYLRDASGTLIRFENGVPFIVPPRRKKVKG